jgi:hypothetical protein
MKERNSVHWMVPSPPSSISWTVARTSSSVVQIPHIRNARPTSFLSLYTITENK